MSLKTRAILVLVIGSVLGLALPLGSALLPRPDSLATPLPLDQGRLLAEVMDRIKRDYVDPVDDQRLLEAAIRGMVADLDAHSQFLDADEYEEIRISTTGNYSGVGIEISLADDAVTVVAPFDDTPAERAGILPGDVIVSINEEPVDPDHLGEAIARLRGRAGTRVSLGILRADSEEPLSFVLVRSFIKVTSVREQLLDDGVAYVRISQFSETTAGDLRKALRRLRRKYDAQLNGLVLDLRNNPGGVLDAAVEVADLFLSAGVIVSAAGRGEYADFVHRADKGDVLKGAAIVVIVNEGSASASEIVAGALQDNARATVIGTTTFGKGSVQTVMPLSSGNAVKLTTSRYFTPSGSSIHETGIEPNVFIVPGENDPALSGGFSRLPSAGDDAQLARAIELLRYPYIVHSKAP